MHNDRKRLIQSQLSRKLTMRFLLWTLAYLLVLFGGYFMAAFFCSQRTWYPAEPLYYILKCAERFAPFLLVVLIFLGVFFITRRFLRLALRYLDTVTLAAEQLATQPEAPIRLPDALHETQMELNLAREHALNAAHQAKEAEQRKNDLVVYLAHDLKTPLTSVIGYLTLLRDEPDLSPAMRAKYTGIALRKAERLEGLINEFFEITRFNLAHLELDLQPVNLTRLLEQSTFEFAPVLAEKQLTWRLQLAPDVPLHCDPDKLQRVFDNLFRNAVNYSYPSTEIRVCLSRYVGGVRVLVQNRGATIPEEKLTRIFSQFFRLDTARRSDTGGAPGPGHRQEDCRGPRRLYHRPQRRRNGDIYRLPAGDLSEKRMICARQS